MIKEFFSKRKISKVLKGVTALGLCLVLCTQGIVFADEKSDAEEQKRQAEEKRQSAQQILQQLEKTKADFDAYIKEMDLQLDTVLLNIQSLEQQKVDLEAQILVKQEELEVAKLEEAAQYEEMCRRIQFMYVNGDEDYMEALISASSMSDVLNQPEYVSAVAEYDYNMLNQLVATREKIANDEQVLEMDLAAVEQLTKDAEEEKAVLDELIAAKTAEVEIVKDQIERQEQLIAQCDAEVAAAAARIQQIEDDARRSGGFVPYSGGQFTWPCPSSTRITSYFGYRKPDGGYVNANHKGIDIGAPTGTPAVAAAPGVVVLSRYSNSAGNWIVISHGNGLYTMYMHGSQLIAREGQVVSAGETIMLVGSTGWSTGPHLHFGVGVGGYTSNYAVDPMGYFQ